MDKQYLAELIKLSEEINREIYAELLGEGVVQNTIDNLKNLPNTNVPAVLRKLAMDVEGKVFQTSKDIQQRGLGGWARGRAADYSNKIKANPGASAAAGGAALAGVAGVAGTLYAAKKAAERRGWMKNGCASISDPSKKAKCQAYLATKKK